MRISLPHLTLAGRVVGTMLLGAVLSVTGLVAYQLWPSARPTTLTLVPAQQMPESLPKKVDFQLLAQPEPVPKLSFVGDDGRAKTLDFHGRPILLNVWATWCVPCRAEMPALDRLQLKLGGPAFQVVALSVDHGGISVVQKFFGELGLKALGIYVDKSGRTTSDLKLVGIPATLLVDRDGREVGRKLGPAAWDSPEAIEEIQRHIGGASGTGTQQARERGEP